MSDPAEDIEPHWSTVIDLLDWAVATGKAEALLWLAGGLLISALVPWLADRVLKRVVERTETELDDVLLRVLTSPISTTAALVGIRHAVEVGLSSAGTIQLVQRLITSVLLIVWGRVVLALGQTVLQRLARTDEGAGYWVREKSLPLFEMAFQIAVYITLGYQLLVTWGLEPTALLASLGIVGVAIGFAAQHSLADLFAGVLILADTPYQLGHYLTLDTGLRGRVTRIGIRSTRLLTLQQVEVIVPNSKMAQATVVNESGGGSPRQRLYLPVGVAYGTDVDHVKRVLIEAALSVPGVVRTEDAPPKARLVGFGTSSVDYTLQVWIDHPALRDDFIDAIHVAVYNALYREEIGIPFPQTDVHLHTVP